jgi:8-oxo-dGTP diphosphatase
MAGAHGGNPDIVAAGAVVTRKGGDVLLVHRAKYDDWSFPKGKLNPGELAVTAAVREVAEETGLDIRLGVPLPAQTYVVRSDGVRRRKVVHYWAGQLVGGDDVSTYAVNDEVDAVRWVPADKVRKVLTYPHDRQTLAASEELPRKTFPLVVLRHARACPRKSWEGPDRERPLSDFGLVQAERLSPVLAAFGVERVISSSSTRCWQTVAPYADLADLEIEEKDDLSEEKSSAESVRGHIEKLVAGQESAVLCTHRPVLPWAFEALSLPKRKLEPGAMLVAHLRRDKIIEVEEHIPAL